MKRKYKLYHDDNGNRVYIKQMPQLSRELHNMRNREYYKRNKNKILERHTKWRKVNPDYDKQYMRDIRQNDASVESDKNNRS